MGSLCNPTDNTLRSNEGQNNQRSFNVKGNAQAQLQIHFTQQKLIHLNGDLLLLFNDHSVNLAHNDHFIKLPTQAHKLQDYAQAQLNKQNSQHAEKKDKEVQFVSFGIMIPTLNYKKVSIVFVDPWNNPKNSRNQLHTVLDDYFATFQGNVPNSLVIAELPSKLGVPVQTGVGALFRSLQKLEPQPKQITFCCLTAESCEVYQNRMQSSGSDPNNSSFVSSESLTSDYY